MLCIVIYMQRLSKILIVLAAAALPFKYGPIYAWPFVFLILAAAAFKLVSITANKTENEPREFFFGTKVLSFFFLFLAIGSVNNWLIYGISYTTLKAIIIDFLLLGIYAIGFLLVLSYGADPKFRKSVLAGFLAPLVFTPFVFMPDLAKKLNFVSGTNMFEGLQKGEPTSFASIVLIPFIILTVSFMRETDWKRKLFYLFGITLTSSLILWSGVRISWFAACFSALLILIFELKRKKTYRLKFAATTFSLLAAAALVSFIVLSHDAQISILNRVFPQVTEYTYSEEIIKSTSLPKALNKIIQNPKPYLLYQHRDSIWPQATRLLVQNPFGLGLNYHVSSRAILQDGQITKAHNLFLEGGLQGGIGALIIYSFFIWKLVSCIMNARKKNEEWLILSVAFSSLFIIAFVNGVFLINDIFIAALILSLEQIIPVSGNGGGQRNLPKVFLDTNQSSV